MGIYTIDKIRHFKMTIPDEKVKISCQQVIDFLGDIKTKNGSLFKID
jgi:hypothetical protein